MELGTGRARRKGAGEERGTAEDAEAAETKGIWAGETASGTRAGTEAGATGNAGNAWRGGARGTGGRGMEHMEGTSLGG